MDKVALLQHMLSVLLGLGDLAGRPLCLLDAEKPLVDLLYQHIDTLSRRFVDAIAIARESDLKKQSEWCGMFILAINKFVSHQDGFLKRFYKESLTRVLALWVELPKESLDRQLTVMRAIASLHYFGAFDEGCTQLINQALTGLQGFAGGLSVASSSLSDLLTVVAYFNGKGSFDVETLYKKVPEWERAFSGVTAQEPPADLKDALEQYFEFEYCSVLGFSVYLSIDGSFALEVNDSVHCNRSGKLLPENLFRAYLIGRELESEVFQAPCSILRSPSKRQVYFSSLPKSCGIASKKPATKRKRPTASDFFDHPDPVDSNQASAGSAAEDLFSKRYC